MKLPLFSAFGVVFTLTSCSTTPSPPVKESSIDFSTTIKPILEERCVMCHNRETMPQRTSFESRELAMAGDKQGPVIIPGSGNASRLITAISAHDSQEQAMPPVSHRVTESEIALLKQWIDEGAVWPSGAKGRIVPSVRPLE